MGFSDDIRRFTTKTTEAHNKITRVATLELFSGVIKATPVDTGRARGNWQTAPGSPVAGETERLDKSGGEAIAEVQAKTPEGAGQVTYLSNNLPYIMTLEEGSSSQAPEGMVKRNMDRVQKMVEAAARKNRV
ncbi:HK97 gp10 family phage protein [Stutzerimonas nitrititolerans]|uniref:HK97 gp10 family phage protein n=1 Tax=Stutzerimonas nitrititolerans TaxID=2482751 RepID=UPI0028AE1C59|nr:HK97 gp10 family phage protein [Stutzerimonas nitrititolerans]